LEDADRRNVTDAGEGLPGGKRYLRMDRDAWFFPAFRAIEKISRATLPELRIWNTMAFHG
jgi:hypothetical protein